MSTNELLKNIEKSITSDNSPNLGTQMLKSTGKSIQNVLAGVADFFNVGGPVKNLLRSLGADGLPSTAEIQAIIAQIVQSNKAKANKVLAMIDSQLNSLPPALSDIVRKAVTAYRDKLLRKRNSIAQTAEQAAAMEEVARQSGYVNDSSLTTEAYDSAKQAVKAAKTASELYEKSVADNQI